MEAKPPPPARPEQNVPESNSSPDAARPGSKDPDVLQLLAEEATVELLIDQLLARTNVEVKRVPIGRVVDAIPPVTDEAGLTVIPIVEETLVVERRLFLKEEVHIQRLQSTEHYQETVQLRHQTAEITRIPADQPVTAQGAAPGSISESKPEDT
jgi:hypothetical protein